MFTAHRNPHVEETINVRTPAIIGRSYTETKPHRYWVMSLKGRWSPPYQATENGARSSIPACARGDERNISDHTIIG